MIKIGDYASAIAMRFETYDGGFGCYGMNFPELVGDDVVIGGGSRVIGEIPSGFVAAGVGRVIKDVESYRLSSLERGVNTKAMAQSEKRES
jgi:hypothetical protein